MSQADTCFQSALVPSLSAVAVRNSQSAQILPYTELLSQ